MKDSWLKFGCFLTGYNYQLMKSSSEASAKAVKKYTSAILIVCIIWGFIGYTFVNRYMHVDIIGSIIGSLIMVFIVVQIERQIILNVGKNRIATIFRLCIALVMAILGSIIIDQMIFKDDIELRSEQNLSEKVNKTLPNKVAEINYEIARLDTLIESKQNERIALIAEVTKTPIIQFPGYETIRKPGKTNRVIVDSLGQSHTIIVDTVYTERKYTSTSRENPKASLISTLDTQINELSAKRDTYSNMKIGIREKIEEQLRSKVGFLDELETMIDILLQSKVALFVYLLWFSFLVFIELFVVSSKWGKNTDTDYDIAIQHQRDVRIKSIKGLTKSNN